MEIFEPMTDILDSIAVVHGKSAAFQAGTLLVTSLSLTEMYLVIRAVAEGRPTEHMQGLAKGLIRNAEENIPFGRIQESIFLGIKADMPEKEFLEFLKTFSSAAAAFAKARGKL